MEQTPHKYVTVAYELYADNEKGIHELIEKAPVEHPFQFISGMGVALDTFEDKILALTQGADFDFTLKQDDAYGPYVQEHVIELPKETFSINGKFDKDMVYPGAVLPLVNADGNRFQGLVLEVKDNVVYNTYSNNKQIIINYNDYDINTNGITIQAKDYKVVNING